MRKFWIVSVSLLVVVLIYVVAPAPHHPQAVAPESEPGQGRVMAADFQLADMHGNDVRLSAFRGQVVILNFWASWCPPCREEMPSMEQLYRQLKDQDVVLLAVNVESDRRAVVDFLDRNPHSFPVLLDSDGVVRTLYGVSRYPETFIIDPQGVVVEKVLGAIDWSQPQVVQFLRSLR